MPTLLFITLVSILCMLSIIDHRTNLLPNILTIPLAVGGILVNYTETIVTIQASIAGVAIGYCGIRLLHDWQLKTKRSPGIGLGDAKFLGALGGWLGWQSIPFLLVGSSIVMLLCYQKRQMKPFGVGLSLSATILLLYETLFASTAKLTEL